MIRSIFLQLFSFVSLANCLDSNFPLNVLELKVKENLSTKKRIYYTDASVLPTFKYSAYVTDLNRTSYGLASPDMDCEVIDILCPQLIQVFQVSDKGVPRLMKWTDVENSSVVEIVDEAGYIGTWPGYCGTDNGALVEMYSPILNAYRYIFTDDQLSYERQNPEHLFWQPINILGYLYSAENPQRTVNYPFNAIRPFTNPVFNRVIVKLRPIIRIKKDNKIANTVLIHENEYLQGYVLDTVTNVSLVDRKTDVKVLEDACGKMNLMFETYDSNSDTYRIRDPKNAKMGVNEDIIKGAGFLFREESSARRCLGEIEPVYEFENPASPGEFHYVSTYDEANNYEKVKKWTNWGQLGFASWGNFAFAKR